MHMKVRNSKKGLIPVAMAFILVLTIVIAAIVMYFWRKAPLATSRLQRLIAISYAETALYEAFNRFRTGTWDIDDWAINGNAPSPNTVIIPTDKGDVTVDINVVLEAGRNKVSATLDYDDIRL